MFASIGCFYNRFNDPFKVDFNGNDKVITECQTSSTSNTIAVGDDIYEPWKRWVMEDMNSRYLHAFSVVGGDPISGVVSITPYFFLQNGWKFRPANYDHKLEITGILITSDSSEPMLPTLSGHNVSILRTVPIRTETVNISGGSSTGDWTSAEKEQIRYSLGVDGNKNSSVGGVINSIKTETDKIASIKTETDKITSIKAQTDNISSIKTQTDKIPSIKTNTDLIDDIKTQTDNISLIKTETDKLKYILGLVQSNFRMKDHIYDSSGRLISAKIRIYDTAADCNNDVNYIKEYFVSSIYDGSGNCISYTVVGL